MDGITLATLAWLFGGCVCWVLAPWLKSLAWRRGILDYPSSPLKLQPAPVAYLGGAAVFVPVAGAWMMLACDSALHRGTLPYAFGLLMLGLSDDVWNLRPISKLIGQIVLALIPPLMGCRLNLYPQLESLDVAFTALWLVTSMNAFNIVDVVDGLATSLGATGAATACVLAVLHSHEHGPLLGGALAGACIAFLRLNRSPASMYLGDAGSLLIGGTLGQLALEVVPASSGVIRWASMAALICVPLLDLALVTIARFFAGRPVYLGSADHFALRLQRAGIGPSAVVTLATGFQALLSAGILIAVEHTGLRRSFLIASGTLALCALLLLLRMPAPERPTLPNNPRVSERLSVGHQP